MSLYNLKEKIEIIKKIGCLQRFLITQQKMQVTGFEDELRVLAFRGYEEIKKIAEEAKEKVNIIYIDQLERYEAFVRVDGITFFTFLLPGEIKEYERNGDDFKNGTSND